MHFNRKLQFSQEYINASKPELSSMMPLHRGHSISLFNSLCSRKLGSSVTSMLCSSGSSMLCGTSLVRPCLGMLLLLKIDYYIYQLTFGWGRVAYMNIFYYFQSHTCSHFIWLNCMVFNHV